MLRSDAIRLPLGRGVVCSFRCIQDLHQGFRRYYVLEEYTESLAYRLMFLLDPIPNLALVSHLVGRSSSKFISRRGKIHFICVLVLLDEREQSWAKTEDSSLTEIL